ncbi:hypothetical protein QN078_08830 [Ralstonia nicotianae]|uniref:Uncharacterized protein n=1 Tax=Ralstonia pseudosolanacearum TaxID=1310165 RepID=A0A454TUG2_9RALS|nr:hypothetical protein [Ralstonia pseudosolanacearum]MCK4132592.1 hypothetical protein [Ralstonia pseudosolanacearum]MDK1380467.1 hypothetical protein [Ralstonia pseudosolanacearum]RAA14670.1 hypothetical protein DOT67_07965 [Ralstonia pseudosolanacearum]RNM08439.1 hypothetical protein EGA29_08190 [Ralstonia pseudosolanacearum]
MRLLPDAPIGRPSFEISEDEIATVVDLLCRSAAEAQALVTSGMLEVPITLHVRKVARRIKKQLGLTSLEIGGEFEVLDLSTDDPEVLGRIDIILRFLHQFGDEDAYLAVECKRVAHGDAALNRRYVTQGVDRFVTGQYAAGHHWGMMLGYVLKLPAASVVTNIDDRIRSAYGDEAKLTVLDAHPLSLAMHAGKLEQGSQGHVIRLLHIFVGMTTAAPTP